MNSVCNIANLLPMEARYAIKEVSLKNNSIQVNIFFVFVLPNEICIFVSFLINDSSKFRLKYNLFTFILTAFVSVTLFKYLGFLILRPLLVLYCQNIIPIWVLYFILMLDTRFELLHHLENCLTEYQILRFSFREHTQI